MPIPERDRVRASVQLLHPVLMPMSAPLPARVSGPRRPPASMSTLGPPLSPGRGQQRRRGSMNTSRLSRSRASAPFHVPASMLALPHRRVLDLVQLRRLVSTPIRERQPSRASELSLVGAWTFMLGRRPSLALERRLAAGSTFTSRPYRVRGRDPYLARRSMPIPLPHRARGRRPSLAPPSKPFLPLGTRRVSELRRALGFSSMRPSSRSRERRPSPARAWTFMLGRTQVRALASLRVPGFRRFQARHRSRGRLQLHAPRSMLIRERARPRDMAPCPARRSSPARGFSARPELGRRRVMGKSKTRPASKRMGSGFSPVLALMPMSGLPLPLGWDSRSRSGSMPTSEPCLPRASEPSPQPASMPGYRARPSPEQRRRRRQEFRRSLARRPHMGQGLLPARPCKRSQVFWLRMVRPRLPARLYKPTWGYARPRASRPQVVQGFVLTSAFSRRREVRPLLCQVGRPSSGSQRRRGLPLSRSRESIRMSRPKPPTVRPPQFVMAMSFSPSTLNHKGRRSLESRAFMS